MDDRCACGRSLPGIRDACGLAVPLEAQPRSGAEGARRADPERQVLGTQKPVEDLELVQGRKALEVDV